MDGKQYFKNCCAELEIDCDTYIKLGAGNPKDNKHYKYQCEPTSIKPSQLYAVKYFEGDDVYVAWNLQDPKTRGRRCLVLLKEGVTLRQPEQVLSVPKGLKDLKQSTERVFVFAKGGVKCFLQTYVALAAK